MTSSERAGVCCGSGLAQQREAHLSSRSSIRWWKRLSRTDAQQPTKGFPVAYLRLTQNRGELDPRRWFKNVLFAGAEWRPDTFGRHDVESATVVFRVQDGATDLGDHALLLTHDDTRPANNGTPATWIHWGDDLAAYLRENSRQGWFVIVERTGTQLTLRLTEERPGWRPGA